MLTEAATPRLARTVASAIALVLATALTGCAAASDPVSEPPAEATETDAGETDDTGDNTGDDAGGDTGDDTAPAGAGGGTVALGTTIYTVNESYNCEIFPDDGPGAPEQSLDLIVIGTSSTGADMQLNVLLQTSSGVSDNTVDYSGDEGIYSDEGNTVVREEGDTIIGAVAVVNEAGSDSRMLQFTLVVPDETIDCR